MVATNTPFEKGVTIYFENGQGTLHCHDATEIKEKGINPDHCNSWIGKNIIQTGKKRWRGWFRKPGSRFLQGPGQLILQDNGTLTLEGLGRTHAQFHPGLHHHITIGANPN